MILKWGGKCACGAQVPAGSNVEWNRDAPKGQQIRKCPACSGPAKTSALVAGRDPNHVAKIEVAAQRQRWRAPDGSSAIVTCRVISGLTEKDPTVGHTEIGVIGPWPAAVGLGDRFEVSGRWEHNQRFGWSLKADYVLVSTGSDAEGLRQYLATLPGIGEAIARKITTIWDGDREQIFRAVETLDPRFVGCFRATQNGSALELAEAARAVFAGDKQRREALVTLAEWSLGPATVAKIMIMSEDPESDWADPVANIKRNPYCLMEVERVGWQKADEVALKHLKLEQNDPRRAAAALAVLLQEEANDGHTWLDMNELDLHFGERPDGSSGAMAYDGAELINFGDERIARFEQGTL